MCLCVAFCVCGHGNVGADCLSGYAGKHLSVGLQCIHFETHMGMPACGAARCGKRLWFQRCCVLLCVDVILTACNIRTYPVDPTSRHMLALKAKPCMCQYECLESETANGSLNH